MKDWSGLTNTLLNTMKKTTKEVTKEELLKNPLVQQIAEEFYESGFDDFELFARKYEGDSKPQGKKDWEILSLKSTEKGCEGIWKKTNKKAPWGIDNFMYEQEDSDKGFYLLENLRLKWLIIHSVKRISDGEVFTIGDNFSWKNHKMINNQILQKLIITEDGKTIMAIGRIENAFKLDDIQKSKVPLFITKDSVEIFEGDSTCFVDKSTYRISACSRDNRGDSMKLVWYFSTIEVAKDWVLLNKPCLSLKDLEKTWRFSDSMFTDTMIDLKKLVQAKLNL